MRTIILSLLLAIAATGSMRAQAPDDTVHCAEVLLETTEGPIRIRLSNATLQHRDNFIKLVKKHFYDSLLFHRTIPGFMIQTGDPDSKNAAAGASLGSTTLDYKLPAEIRYPQLFHRRGAVAAAREGDSVNPEHKSDACQFYIVWGKPVSVERLEKEQQRIDTLFADSVKMPQNVFDTYRETGGTPHLDGGYTVFGQVVSGLDVVDKIQRAETDKQDRPLTDIRILKATVVKDLPGASAKKKSRAATRRKK